MMHTATIHSVQSSSRGAGPEQSQNQTPVQGEAFGGRAPADLRNELGVNAFTRLKDSLIGGNTGVIKEEARLFE